MFAYVGRRLLASVALLFGVTVIAFLLVTVIPSDPVLDQPRRAGGDPAAVKAYQEHYGLDKPLPLR